MWKLLPFVLLVGCITLPNVRQSDLESWKGVSVKELKQHPKLSQFAMDIKTYSDGKQLITFNNSIKQSDEIDCRIKGDRAKCKVDEGMTIGCANEFLVSADDRVLEVNLRPIGLARCATDCSFRPSSRPCSSDAH